MGFKVPFRAIGNRLRDAVNFSGDLVPRPGKGPLLCLSRGVSLECAALREGRDTRVACRRSFARICALGISLEKLARFLLSGRGSVPETATGLPGEQPLVGRAMWVREVGQLDMYLR